MRILIDMLKNYPNIKRTDLLRFISICLCLILLNQQTVANETSSPVQIYAYTLEYRLNEKGDKHYNKLLKRIASEGLNFNVLVRPLPRSVRSMKENQFGCLFPTTPNAIKVSDPELASRALIASDPIDRISLRVFTNSEKPKIMDLKDLNGKRVALWNGLDPKIFLGGIDATVETTPNEEVRVKMLNADRIDAILGFTPDVLLVAEELDLKAPHYSSKLALFEDEGASIVCHDNDRNRVFIKAFNKSLKNLKLTGEIKEILGPYADIVY